MVLRVLVLHGQGAGGRVLATHHSQPVDHTGLRLYGTVLQVGGMASLLLHIHMPFAGPVVHFNGAYSERVSHELSDGSRFSRHYNRLSFIPILRYLTKNMILLTISLI